MSDLGDLLRRARAYKGATLRDAERATRISRNYLAALEAHDFDQLPPRAYSRGIVRNYAQYLGLDPAVVLNLFDEASGNPEEPESVDVIPPSGSVEIHSNWAPNFAIIAFMLVISAVAFTWIYSAYLQPEEEVVPTAAVQPTATPVEESLLAKVAETATADVAADASATPSAPATSTASEPTVTADVELTATPPPSNTTAENQGMAVDTADQSSTSSGSSGSESSVDTTGANVFSVFAEKEVWVQITINGGTVVFNDVLPADSWTDAYPGDTATITSGDANLVRVFVNGEDWGKLGGGEPWDAVVTYP